jgi:preprotein translocase subunit SecA
MDRLGSRWVNHFYKLFGSPAERRLARAALSVDRIRYYESVFGKLTDEQLKQESLRLRGRARGGEPLDRLLPEAFGLVCVAAYRQIGLRPYDVQLAGGVIIHHGALAELATGEGKTLVASLPAYLNALTGKGVHITTVNDYLARRDAEWMGPIYRALGLTVAALQMQMPDQARHQAYRCDITYGMASEFGFDFLRDRLRIRAQGQQGTAPFWAAWSDNGERQPAPLDPKVQREHHYAIVDEADSILIDEARTPLIISTGTQQAAPEETIVYTWADRLARQMLPNQHFTFDVKKQKLELTEEGRHLARWSNPPGGPHSHAMDKLYEHIERALHAHYRFRRDQHYLVEQDKVVIIDEYTGRRMPDRHWREGLHQAVEAKEGVPITKASDHAAQITFQNYFRLYQKLAGMTGTAATNAREFRKVYKLRVVVVPTNRPIRREQWPDRIFGTEDAKFDAVVADVRRLIEQGRPVLIGTRSVEKSEKLSAKLTAAGIEHQVLNARQHEQEARVVAQAGQRARVTIATNMAGRGTDIILGGNPEPLALDRLRAKYQNPKLTRLDIPRDEWELTVREVELEYRMKEEGRAIAALGGLHVLGTERHDARRIDRQLAGRAGRQGDPGSCQFFLSLEDELLEALGPRRQARLQEIGRRGRGNWARFRSLFFTAQRITERRHYKQRVDLMVHDKQRQEILKELGADPYVD